MDDPVRASLKPQQPAAEMLAKVIDLLASHILLKAPQPLLTILTCRILISTRI